MRLLLDTQLVIWLVTDDPRLPSALRDAVAESFAEVTLSVASLWEVAIKFARRRPDFRHAPMDIRAAARRAGWAELAVLAEHAMALATLPDLHGDPFDRLLVAQARVEGMTLLTADRTLARYGHPVRPV